MPASALSVTADLSDERPDSCREILPGLNELIAQKLAPQVIAIDQEGRYPREFLQRLGNIGGFAGAVAPEYGGLGSGLKHVIEVMERVSQECLSTGFLVWCQTTLAWYLQNTPNETLRRHLLPAVTRGEVLGGTGLSNTMKSCASIEGIRLKARRRDGGYIVNGSLPWVSNIGPEHYFACGAAVEGESELLIALVHGSTPGLTLNQNAHFVALEGTNTFTCLFKDVLVPDAQVLAHPREFPEFVARIKPGFILNQMGMGLGLAAACCAMMHQSNRTLAHVNRFLDAQVDALEEELDSARQHTYALAEAVYREPGLKQLREVIEVRIAGSELALKTAGAAMLHMGARGYLTRSPAQRRLRESYFVAIVTPALKHLKKELATMPHSMQLHRNSTKSSTASSQSSNLTGKRHE